MQCATMQVMLFKIKKGQP